MQISDIKNPWRDRYGEASFRGAIFHVEMQGRDSGRRNVVHEYPKRDQPYAEDMGRRARTFSVAGYLIGPNYLDDKDFLQNALEEEGPGTLKLPMADDQQVSVLRYTIQESRDKGGYCTIDMMFVEAGVPGFTFSATVPGMDVSAKATALDNTTTNTLDKSLEEASI